MLRLVCKVFTECSVLKLAVWCVVHPRCVSLQDVRGASG